MERLRTDSWSNYSHPADVVKPVCGIPTFPFTAKAILSKGHIFFNLNNPPYTCIDRRPTANER